MLIGKFGDGTFRKIEMDLKNPMLEDLSGLTEVYRIGKIYKTKLSLKAEPVERKPRKPRDPNAKRPGRPKKPEPINL